MLQKKYIGIVLLLLVAVSASAQKAERDYIRKGNRFFKDSVYVDAEVNYRKALEVNPKSTVSMFNLGNTLTQQNKPQEAMEQYVGATKIEKDKSNLAQIYHNMGVIFHSQKDYAKAVEAYKESLRNNPKDDETRYNLALAQKQLQDQQQNQDQNQDQDKQDQQKEQDKQQDQRPRIAHFALAEYPGCRITQQDTADGCQDGDTDGIDKRVDSLGMGKELPEVLQSQMAGIVGKGINQDQNQRNDDKHR